MAVVVVVIVPISGNGGVLVILCIVLSCFIVFDMFPHTVPDKFIFLASTGKFFNVILQGSDADMVPIISTVSGRFANPIAVDHLMRSEDEVTIFFTDTQRKVISSMNIDGTGEKIWLYTRFE